MFIMMPGVQGKQADICSGAVFVILSKANGWYIVQKDPDGLGQIAPDNTKSGWVPAGMSDVRSEV